MANNRNHLDVVDPEKKAQFMKQAEAAFKQQIPVTFTDSKGISQKVLLSEENITAGPILERLERNESVEAQFIDSNAFTIIPEPIRMLSKLPRVSA